MADIGVVGSNMVDLITYVDRLPARGETLEAPRFAMGCGGKGANQAVAAARLGSRVVMVSKVGDDTFGGDTIRNFERHGIDARYVTVAPGQTSGVAPITVEPGGENSILIVKGANDHLSPGDVDAAAADLRACRLILLQLEIPLATILHTVRLAVASGVPVLLNPAPASPALDLAQLAGVAYLVPNRGELALLTGKPTDTLADVQAASLRVCGAGIGHVITTLGSGGVCLVAEGVAAHVPTPSVEAVDTTGAGDAFIGGFAHFLVGGAEPLDAARLAASYAALSVTRPGTQSSYADAATFAAFRASRSMV